MASKDSRYSKKSNKTTRSKKNIIPAETLVVKNRCENDEDFDKNFQFNTATDDREAPRNNKVKKTKYKRAKRNATKPNKLLTEFDIYYGSDL